MFIDEGFRIGLLPAQIWEMTLQDFLDMLRVVSKKLAEQKTIQARDDQKNAILIGFYTALFERQRVISFPTQMIEDLYREKEAYTREEVKQSTARLKELVKRGGVFNARQRKDH